MSISPKTIKTIALLVVIVVAVPIVAKHAPKIRDYFTVALPARRDEEAEEA